MRVLHVNRSGLILLLPLAGLISSILTICLLSSGFWPGALFVGFVFGAIIGGVLAFAGVFSGPQAIRFIFVTTPAYFLSYLAAFAVQWVFFPWDRAISQLGIASPIALLAGGLVGGMLLLGIGLRIEVPGPIARALFASISGGALALVGWALSPYLGPFFWRLLSAGVTSQRVLPLDDRYGYGQHELVCSLFVVWQTGMALVIGLLAGHAPESHRDLATLR